jgi:hypothetical protein
MIAGEQLWVCSLSFVSLMFDGSRHPSRNSNGTLVPFPDFFPDGMIPVIDYVHSLGLKVRYPGFTFSRLSPPNRLFP